MFCYSTKLQIRTFCSQRQTGFARRRSFWLHPRKHNSQPREEEEENLCRCNNEQYQEHQVESKSLSSLRSTTLTKVPTYKTKLVDDDKAQCIHSTSVQEAIARGSQLEKQLLQYFASSLQRLSSSQPHSSSEQPEQSVNSLLPITGTALAWQMHTAFYADAITRPMLFPQRVQHTHTMHHTTPNQEENCFDAQSTNGKTHTSDSDTISTCSHEPSISSERIVNLNAILRSALHRTSTSGVTYATLRDSGEYRMLDSRFTNKPEQEKDLTNAEVPFIKLLNDLQRIWDNVVMAHTSIRSLYKMLSSPWKSESSSLSSLVTISPEQAFRPNCVVFLTFYAHQRNSCAATSHMIDIANMIKELVNVNNSTCCSKESNKECSENSDTITNETNNNGTNINCSTHSTVCADNVLKVITIIIGFEPPPLSLMSSTESLHNTHARMEQKELIRKQKTKHTCQRKQKNKFTINTMHYEVGEVEDTLCYSHAGAYTLNGILHIIQSLTSFHDNKDASEHLQTEEKEDILQKRVFILSESWLTPRTLTALHSLPHIQIEHEQVVCKKTNKSKLTNYENSNNTYTDANDHNIHRHIKLTNKNSDNTIIEVIPTVVSNSLSEVEKNAIARYTFCRMIKENKTTHELRKLYNVFSKLNKM